MNVVKIKSLELFQALNEFDTGDFGNPGETVGMCRVCQWSLEEELFIPKSLVNIIQKLFLLVSDFNF